MALTGWLWVYVTFRLGWVWDLDSAGLVSIAIQRYGDVVDFLGEVFLVANVVCPANKGLVD